MKHFGDIRQISGFDIPIVDCVTGGSPCQDLSLAGKKKGLAGDQSGLFMEQIRVVKEMRENDRQTNQHMGVDVRPRFMVWENVKGALSTNDGDDFRIVLEQTAKIANPNTVIPRPSGKWTKSGCILGDGWSVAWRVHDAQFWGVPQRRPRIALVADFGGEAAPEVLFERQGLSGYSYSGRSAGNLSPRETEERLGEKSCVMTMQAIGVYSECGVASSCKRRDYKDATDLIIDEDTVRRFTPLECERLQGFPDGWTDIGHYIDSSGNKRMTRDSDRYEAIGNSIALPFWFWLLRRISALYERCATLGSLFDGIGGFPLCWERCNGTGSAIWASEIEEFQIAVTKKHFPGNGEDGEK